MKLLYCAFLTSLALLTTGYIHYGHATSPSPEGGVIAENRLDLNPCAAANPCAAKDPCAAANPCAAKDPCAAANPCAAKDPCAAANPCAAKDPCAAANPCAAKDPCAAARQSSLIYRDRGNIALKGQDVVSYFTQGKVVPGSSRYTHEWQGAVWQFSSAANRNRFAQNPSQYAPQYGGYCAKAMAEGNIAPTDPEAWHIHQGKLYLNYDKSVQAQWLRDVPGNIALANKNYPGVLASR